MSVLLLTLTWFGTLASPSLQRPSAPVSTLIEKYKVGNLILGTSAADVYDSLPAERRRLVDLGHEGQLTPALQLTLPGASQPFSVVAELGCQQGLIVDRIFVTDPVFRTATGVGVGSTVRELRAAYTLGSFSTEEGSAGVVVAALSATFVLDQAGANLDTVKVASALPDAVRIIGILLWK